MSESGDYAHPAAFGICAEKVCAFFLDGRSAIRADCRPYDVFVARTVYGRQYFRYHVVAPSDKYRASYSDVFAEYVAVIVQRSAFHGGSAQFYRLEKRKRREFTRSAHLPYHVLNGSRSLFRLEFIRYCPTREFVRIS